MSMLPSLARDGEPAPRQEIAEGQGEQDPEPEKRSDRDNPGQAVPVEDVHIEEADQYGLGRGDRERRGQMQWPERQIRGPDGREEQDQEREEDNDVGTNGNDMSRHERTSIR